MRRSIVGVMILAWRPGIADLLGLERFGGREGEGAKRGVANAGRWRRLVYSSAARMIVSARVVAEGCSQKKEDPLDGSRAVF
jgi:hypothetical protein